MERNIVTPDRITEMEDLMFRKIEIVADYLRTGKNECAMIELGTLNDYTHMLAKLAMANITVPNNML